MIISLIYTIITIRNNNKENSKYPINNKTAIQANHKEKVKN